MSTPLPSVGSRVVMRYRLPEGYGASMTDVIGELVTLDPPTVRTAAGDLVSVQIYDVVALKALGPAPIRSSEIRNLEAAAADAWPGVEHELIDGWLARSGYGFTHRGNSAVPLGSPGSYRPDATSGFATTASVSLERISRWYAERGLPPVLVLPDRIVPIPPGWPTFGESLVMAADLDQITLPEGPSLVAVDAHPSRGWFELFSLGDPRVSGPAAAEVLVSVRNGVLGFASIGDPSHPDYQSDPQFTSTARLPLAIARGAVTAAPDGRRWIGITAAQVVEAHRGHGLGTLICGELMRWGRTHGATHAYLQVSVENAPAIAMYRELGFLDHHRYRYTRPPGFTL